MMMFCPTVLRFGCPLVPDYLALAGGAGTRVDVPSSA